MDNNIAPTRNERAWVEIDLDALAYNVNLLRSVLQEGCELMAVVKADAYGHGALDVAKQLEKEGVKAFAVATVSEGVSLRANGLAGDILVLNYTHPQSAGLLSQYDLKQLVVDGDYGKALNDTGHRISVHISIDTGMHREGIDMEKTAEIESVFNQSNLTVEGMSTHFASSDSLSSDDIAFTHLQNERFYSVVDDMKRKGYPVGKLHTQATYGMFNFEDSRADYARLGIALYGVMSHNDETRIKLPLRPVLALKAMVSQVRWINAGESVSYARTFVADRALNLATVCIGYADGVPRSMSGNNGVCLAGGYKVPIIGRICMDLLMIDVTDVPSLRAGDIVTLIGTDGSEEIRCEDFAQASGTITNEILCRLGSRLPRVYI